MDTKTIRILAISTIILAVLILYKFSSTQSHTAADTSMLQATNQLPTDFITFYDQFHTDTSYQKAHIIWPLQGLKPDSNGTNHVHTWTRANWVIHKPLDTTLTSFEVSYKVLSPSLIEEQVSAIGYGFSMLRRFAKTNDNFQLIYYKSMGPI